MTDVHNGGLLQRLLGQPPCLKDKGSHWSFISHFLFCVREISWFNKLLLSVLIVPVLEAASTHSFHCLFYKRDSSDYQTCHSETLILLLEMLSVNKTKYHMYKK